MSTAYLKVPDAEHPDSQHLYRGSGAWTNGGKLPNGAMSDMAVAVDPTGEYVYMVGGINSTGHALTAAWRFDVLLEEWEELPAMPDTRFRHGSAITDQGLLVVAGGFGRTGDMDLAHDSAIVLDTAALLDSSNPSYRPSPTWQAAGNMRTKRGDLCLAAVGETVYASGGFSEFYDTLDEVQVLDLGASDDVSSLVWADAPALPEPRGDVSCVGLGGRVYLSGGYYDPTGEWKKDSFHADLFSLLPGDAAWERKASATHARGDGALAALPASLSGGTHGDRLVLLGGETHARNLHTQVPDHRVEVFLVEHNEWVEKAPMANARFRMGAAGVTGGLVWVMGGHRLCKTGWFDDWDNPDCPMKAYGDMEVFADLDHPDVHVVTDL